jgi:hypothetical protein
MGTVMEITVTDYRPDGRQGTRIFYFFATASRQALGSTQPSVQGVLGAKLPEREAGKVKNKWSYTSTFPYVFMAWCLLKHRDNFIFYLLRKLHCLSFNLILKRSYQIKEEEK